MAKLQSPDCFWFSVQDEIALYRVFLDAIGFVHSTGSENPIDPIPESMEGTHQAFRIDTCMS